MRILLTACVVLIVFSCAAITANADVLNGGFEVAAGTVQTNIVDDGFGNITTNVEANFWFAENTDATNNATGFRTGTNSPAAGQFEDPDWSHISPGINNSGSTNTARTGGFSARVFGPFANLCCQKVSVAQVITNAGLHPVLPSQIWVMKGFGLNWSGDPLYIPDPAIPEGQNFGLLQIEFFNAAGVSLLAVDSQHLTTSTVVDTWISCSVTGVAPNGTTYIKFRAAHVGLTGALGSIFWDDLSATNTGVQPPPVPVPLEPAAIRTGVQVCWPTVADTSYQPQYSEDNANWVNIIATNAAQQLLPGDGTTNCIFSTSHKFYRVLQQPGTPASPPLSNAGFESGTTTQADNWVQFNNAYRSGTNNTQFGITAHNNSAFSMQTYGPFGTNLDASGASQELTASAGQNWRFTGYCLNWQNDKLNGPDGFGVAQLQFLDSTGGTGNVLQVVEGSRFGTDVPFPLDTWQFFEVDATNAPAGTTKVQARVLHVGMAGDGGSVWWDDLAIYQPIGSSSAGVSTNQPAVQVYWPTTAPSNGVNYQVQAATNLVFIPPPIVNFLTNGGFEADAILNNPTNVPAISGWNTANGGSKTTSSATNNPTHSGIGALRLFDNTTAVPVVFQGRAADTHPISVTPGQVWDLSGYALVTTNDSPLQGTAFGCIKIVWQTAGNVLVQPLTSDTNSVGTIVTGSNAGIESAHVLGTTFDTWKFIQARGTVPAGAANVQVVALEVGFAPGGAIRFDDLVLTTNIVDHWTSLGPVYPGNGATNTLVSDPIGTNTQKFYRVFTP